MYRGKANGISPVGQLNIRIDLLARRAIREAEPAVVVEENGKSSFGEILGVRLDVQLHAAEAVAHYDSRSRPDLPA